MADPAMAGARAVDALTDEALPGLPMTAVDRIEDDLLAERYRYICEAGHTTVTTAARYDVCTAVLPFGGTVPGLPCGAPTEYRVIPYDEDFDL